MQNWIWRGVLGVDIKCAFSYLVGYAGVCLWSTVKSVPKNVKERMFVPYTRVCILILP